MTNNYNRRNISGKRSRNERLETLKRDMLNMWIIFKRMPLLLFYFSLIIGGITITGTLIGYIIRIIIGK